MPIPTLLGLPPKPTFDDVVNKLNSLVKEINHLMLTLDSLNVVSLTADHIDTGTLDANLVTIRSDLASSAFIRIDGSGMVINNGSFDTFVVNTNGQVTMTGATVQTATEFPKVVIDPPSNLLRAAQSSSSYLEILALYPSVLSPALRFISPTRASAIYQDQIQLSLITDGDILLFPSGHVKLPNWGSLLNSATGRTLQQELNDLNARITALGG